jgi:hypothetical protein
MMVLDHVNQWFKAMFLKHRLGVQALETFVRPLPC